MKFQKIQSLISVVFLLVLFSGFFSGAPVTEFGSIKLRSNPAIIFSNTQDTISNRTAGYIDMRNSILRPKYVVPEQKTYTGSYWEVSGDYDHNADLKISNDLQAAITAIDSGYIFVHKGTYGKIVAKNNVTIIGASPDQVFISSSDDTTLVYANGKRNFTMRNITIQSTGATTGASKSLINLVNCYVDSLTSPKIVFDNIRLIGVNNTSIYGIKSDSSRYKLTNSYVTVTNSANADARACLYLRKGSYPYLNENILICYGGDPADRIFSFEDIRCRITFGFNEMNITPGALMVEGSSVYARAYNNVCNVAYDGFVNLIASGNNIEDANFFIR